jgi:N-acetylglucosamine kinase-like BadF-type ATPase
MNYFVGIDGGGSTLRVVVVDADLRVLAQATRSTVNPSVVGHERAAALIQDALREAAGSLPVTAVGIGVAGASAVYAAEWLRATVDAVLPGVAVAASMDNEIALVGAHGQRRGVLVLAGTGSVAYGVNDAGEGLQTGGWGYLIGDEGSGYWLGSEALRGLIQWSDGISPQAEALAAQIMQRLGFARPVDVIPWVYRQPPPTREIAELAPLVLAAAQAGDAFAGGLVARAADALTVLVRTIERRLHLHQPAIAFAGGLLTTENPLSQALCGRLGLAAIPQPRYPPVIGAALLAKLTLRPQDTVKADYADG